MLKKLFLLCVVLVVLLAAIGFVLPGAFTIENSITVAAKPGAIYATVADLRTWPEWTVWNREADPKVEWSWSGASSGKGAIWSWKGDSLGTGTLTIDSGSPESGIAYTMTMEGMNPVQGNILLTAQGDATLVRWSDKLDMGMNPAWRWMGLIMKGVLGSQFEKNLKNLKARVEGKSGTGKPVDASLKK